MVKKKTATESAGKSSVAKKASTAKKKSAPRKKAKAVKADSTLRQARATLMGVRISPRKMRWEIDLIRGKQIEPALQILTHSPRKSSRLALKLLKSAIANARSEALSLDVDKLWITEGFVNMGETIWRFMPRAQGRATPIAKRSAHITLVLAER